MMNFCDITSFKKDFLASIIVFLIAMPLAIGISIACGLPVYSGLIAAIIGGIVVGIFSGNSLQVSGPAAGLILIIVDIIANQGIDKLFLIIFVVGLMQITFGLFSLVKWFRAISPAIIQGMLAGIGISIFLSQFHIMLDSQPQNSFIENWIRVLATSKASTTFKVVTTNTQFAAADEAGGPTEVERTDIITGRSVGEGMRRQHFKEICTEPEQPWGRKRFHR